MPDLAHIVGQDAAIGQLMRAMDSNRMPHAYLFVGPEGVGRRTTAAALANLLLCETPVAAHASAGAVRQACGRCQDCRTFAAGTHPDFHLIYKELARFHDDPGVRSRVMQDLGIDVIRSFLIAPANRSSARGRGKVFLVREAELLSAAAQNALLKTLEEPPPLVTVILIVQRREQVLPTILSRCHIVNFGPLPRDFVTGQLRQSGVAAPEARFWAAFTQGSIGRSLTLWRQGYYAIQQDILDRLANSPLVGDPELGEHLVKIMETLADDLVKQSKTDSGASMSKNLASRQAAGALLELIASAYQDALRLSCDRQAASSQLIHADQFHVIEAFHRRFQPHQLASIIEQLSDFEELLWRNVNPKVVWENVAITCSTAAPLRL